MEGGGIPGNRVKGGRLGGPGIEGGRNGPCSNLRGLLHREVGQCQEGSNS